jgi:translation elongation factor EF-1alpha
MAEETPQEGELIGQITHYFGNIGVAVIELVGTLKVGDNIRIIGGETDFNQAVESMQYDHQEILEAKKGQSVGMKVKEKVHEGYKVYKV